MDPILLQKQVRDNAEDFQNCLKDLKNWESEMKRKEDELFPDSKGQAPAHANQPSALPPVRNKVRKTENNAKREEILTQNNSSSRPRISGFDYVSWDKFDVDKACQQVDTNLEESEEDTESEEEDVETERLHDEAMYEKEKGNQFVKSQKWTNAIECYSRAIECYPYDAIFFANRALCHLKTSDLKAAETDCTSALNLDISYVKAFQRRAAARIGLGLLEEAKLDFQKVIQLEPKNASAKGELVKIEKKINAMQNEKKHLLNEKKKADDGVASSSLEKNSIASTSSSEGKCEKANASLDWKKCWFDKEKKVFEGSHVASSSLEKDISISSTSSFGGGGEKVGASQELKKCLIDQGNEADVRRRVMSLSPVKDESVASTSNSTSMEGGQIVYPIYKPPHLRSKKPMKEINIKIINSGMSKIPVDLTEFVTYPKVIEVEETTSNVMEIVQPVKIQSTVSSKIMDKQTKSPMAAAVKSIEDISDVPPPPLSYIDFYAAWKRVKHSPKMRFLYLKQTPGEQLSKMFQESLESTTFSELIETLEIGFLPSKEPVYPYLLGMSNVKRLSALTLFMNNVDKTRMEMLLDNCERLGECTKDESIMLKKKFEL